MSKAIIFFAPGTEECEALLVVDLLRRAKVEVCVAAVGGSLEVTSSHGITIRADALAEEADYDAADMVILPGGIPGTPNLEACPAVTNAVRSFAQQGKKIAAICAAPSVFGHMGLLEGKRATSHRNFRGELTGAEVLDEEVVVDGNVTTSFGLGGAIPFALELVKQLAGEEQAEKIKYAIEYLH